MGHESALRGSPYDPSNHGCSPAQAYRHSLPSRSFFSLESSLRDVARSRLELSPVPSASRWRGPHFLGVRIVPVAILFQKRQSQPTGVAAAWFGLTGGINYAAPT